MQQKRVKTHYQPQTTKSLNMFNTVKKTKAPLKIQKDSLVSPNNKQNTSFSAKTNSTNEKAKVEPIFLTFNRKNFHSFEITSNQNIIRLALVDCRLKELPLDFLRLTSSLRHLDLSKNLFIRVPSTLYHDFELETVNFSRNLLESLPENFNKWKKSLLNLDVSYNQIAEIEYHVAELSFLRKLFIHNNNFTKLPSVFHFFDYLEEFSLDWFKYTFPSMESLINCNFLASFKTFCKALLLQKKPNFLFIDLIHNFSRKKIDFIKLFPKKRNPLHRAALENDVGVLNSLINLIPERINDVDSENHTPLFLSILEENFNVTKILLHAGADPNISEGMLGGCLHLAVVKKEIFLLQDLLKRGGDPNLRDIQGNTPFHLLFSTFSTNTQKSEKIANFLLENNADTTIKNKELWTCIHLAVKTQQIDALRFAMKFNSSKGQEIFRFDDSGGEMNMTALHLAGYQGNRDMVGLLLENGCNYEAVDYMERKLKHFCVEDQFLMKLCRAREKRDIQERLSSVIKKTITTKRSLYLKIETSEREDYEEKINLPAPINFSSQGFFSNKIKYFGNQNSLDYGLFMGRENEEENEILELDECKNERKNLSLRVILKSPNNISKIEQYQNVRMNFFRKSSEKIPKEELENARIQKSMSLKTFSLQNLESLIQILSENNEKIKEELFKITTERKIIDLEVVYAIFNLKIQNYYYKTQINAEMTIIDLLFEQANDNIIKIEYDRVKASLASLMDHKNSESILRLFMNSLKSSYEKESFICCLFILNHLKFFRIKKVAENLRDYVNLNLKEGDYIDKIILYEIFSNFFRKKSVITKIGYNKI